MTRTSLEVSIGKVLDGQHLDECGVALATNLSFVIGNFVLSAGDGKRASADRLLDDIVRNMKLQMDDGWDLWVLTNSRPEGIQ